MCKKLTKTEIQDISNKNFESITFIRRGKNKRYGLFFCSKHETTSRQFLTSHYKGINPCKVCRKIAGRPRRKSISDINQRLEDKFEGVIKFHSYHTEDRGKAYFECSIHGKTIEKYMGNVLHSNQRNNPCNKCQNEEVFEPNNKLTKVNINDRLLKNGSKLSFIRRKANDSRYGIFRCSKHGHLKRALIITSVLRNEAECKKCKENILPPPNKFSKTDIQKLSDKALGNFIFLGRSAEDSNIGIFICKAHYEKGIHRQLISNHIRGANPCCGRVSKGEEWIMKYLIHQGYAFSQNKSFEQCTDVRSLFFDFHIPEFNLLVEYDGEQHYRPIARFGGIENFKRGQLRDRIKTEFANENKFNFLRIPYTHINNINGILKTSFARIKNGERINKELTPSRKFGLKT